MGTDNFGNTWFAFSQATDRERKETLPKFYVHGNAPSIELDK
jgi:hypothetical protein